MHARTHTHQSVVVLESIEGGCESDHSYWYWFMHVDIMQNEVLDNLQRVSYSTSR